MNVKFVGPLLAAAVVGGGLGISSARATIIDFETTPSLSTGPSIYVAVPAPQTVVTTPATLSGARLTGRPSPPRLNHH